MLRPVSEVADLDPGWDRPVVTLIQFSSTAGVTMLVLSVIWSRPVPSGLLERLSNTFFFFFVAKKAGAQRFIVDARVSNRQYLSPPLNRCSQERDTAMSNFIVRLRTLKTGLWIRPILRMCFVRMRSPL